MTHETLSRDLGPYDLRDRLGDSWGETVLVKYVNGEASEYYAAVPGANHLREAWPDYFDEPVWMHVNEVGYRLNENNDRVSWALMDWDDVPVSADWGVEYP